jgi:hypothetical protein
MRFGCIKSVDFVNLILVWKICGLLALVIWCGYEASVDVLLILKLCIMWNVC